MDRRITRRDFLNGVGVTLTGSIAYPWFAEGTLEQAAFAPEQSPTTIPGANEVFAARLAPGKQRTPPGRQDLV